MKYFTDPQGHHIAAARALLAVANLRAKSDGPSARVALACASFHLMAASLATPQNNFLATHMQDWPI